MLWLEESVRSLEAKVIGVCETFACSVGAGIQTPMLIIVRQVLFAAEPSLWPLVVIHSHLPVGY